MHMVWLARVLAAGLLEQFRAASCAPQPIDRTVAGDRCEPGARPLRNAVQRPAAQRFGERLLGALLGQVPIARAPDQGSDDAAPLLTEGRIDGVLDGGIRQSSQKGRTSIALIAATG